MKTDLTDSGQVFNALTSHFNMGGYEGKNVPGPPDVVIHFAGLFYPFDCPLGLEEGQKERSRLI